MLDHYIIDDLRRREKERQRIDNRPRLELPVDYSYRPEIPSLEKPIEDDGGQSGDGKQRGIIVIDI